jgi:glycosyltransferase involved in cell wall biosynthesis
VSVVVPTYNRANLAPRAVESALACCTADDEVIVVDDGSTDGTRAALAPYGNRIRYVLVERGGAGRARNRGIAEARHDLVAFLDSDDQWMPDALDVKRTLMHERPDVVFCFSDFASRTTSGQVDRRALRFWHEDPRGWDEILERIAGCEPSADAGIRIGSLYASEMRANYVFTSTMVARRSAAGSALRFAEDLPTYEDWECFGRLARTGPAAFIPWETAWQHRHDGPRLTDAGVIDSAYARIQVLERVWGADSDFLARQRRAYQAVLDAERRRYGKALVVAGRRDEARAAMRGLPLSALMRMALGLPAPVVRLGIEGRRLYRRVARAGR